MTRAVNLALSEKDIRARCADSGISISAIEPLASGGTHLVCTTRDGADAVRVLLAGHIIEGAVRRVPFYRPTTNG